MDNIFANTSAYTVADTKNYTNVFTVVNTFVMWAVCTGVRALVWIIVFKKIRNKCGNLVIL